MTAGVGVADRAEVVAAKEGSLVEEEVAEEETLVEGAAAVPRS